jgi:hypothetical protein
MHFIFAVTHMTKLGPFCIMAGSATIAAVQIWHEKGVHVRRASRK